MTPLDLALLLLAGIAAGVTNALAGGGTLFTFPVLLAVGVPPVAANVTNTVALCPGYVGGIVAQWRDLRGQGRRMVVLGPVAATGGLFGGWLLLRTSDAEFIALVPPLLLAACALLALQDPVRRHLDRRIAAGRRGGGGTGWALLPVAGASVYGGYFGPGVSVMFLAVLGALVSDTLTRLNALKQVLAFTVNLAAALFFIGSDKVVWPAAAAMAAGALGGGVIGGRIAKRIAPTTLRRVVIVTGVAVALLLWWRG